MTHTIEITGRTTAEKGVCVAWRSTSIGEYTHGVRVVQGAALVRIDLGNLDKPWPETYQSIELSPDQAEHLAALLISAAEAARAASVPPASTSRTCTPTSSWTVATR